MERQNPLKSIPKEEFDAAFKLIETYFNLNWLENRMIKNPVAETWNRKDWLATNELFTLGSCIGLIDAIDSTWLKAQIKKIKNGNSNQISGALFEILSIGYMADKSTILPTKDNQPGYDAIINLKTGLDLRLSIKNYSLSAHQSNFNKEVIQFEADLVGFLEYFKIKQCQVVIYSPEKVPEKKDWKNLKKRLPEIFKIYKEKGIGTFAFDDKSWIVMIGKLTDEDYIDNKISYSLIASSIYHKNEHKNIFSKLENACSNLLKHSSIESDNIKNGLLIRIPTTVSINNCLNWINDYFMDNPDKPLSTVLLYQPSLAENIKEGSHFIHHCFKWYQKQSFSNLGSNLLNFTIPVGRIDNKPVELKIRAEGIGELSVGDRYILQRGNHYIKSERKSDGSFVGNVSMISPGINKHVVFSEPFDKELVLSGIFPPNDELCII